MKIYKKNLKIMSLAVALACGVALIPEIADAAVPSLPGATALVTTPPSTGQPLPTNLTINAAFLHIGLGNNYITASTDGSNPNDYTIYNSTINGPGFISTQAANSTVSVGYPLPASTPVTIRIKQSILTQACGNIVRDNQQTSRVLKSVAANPAQAYPSLTFIFQNATGFVYNGGGASNPYPVIYVTGATSINCQLNNS